MDKQVNIFWFRRDLRLNDNAAVYHALRAGRPVLPIFIFDTNILNKLQDRNDRRVAFIQQAIARLDELLRTYHSSLRVYYGTPLNVFQSLLREYDIEQVFTNHDYEPYARDRDSEVKALLAGHSISFCTFKDQVIFEKDEVLKNDGKPYTVFTPYSRCWKEMLSNFYLSNYPTDKYLSNFLKLASQPVPSLEEIGFVPVDIDVPSAEVNEAAIKQYEHTRDYPADETGTTRLGVHLRFGTISIRELASLANQISSTYLNELIWREFYQMLLWHFPHVVRQSFKQEYDNIQWRNSEEEFEKWCKGMTGYPLVDAGMRQLNATGFMHNRVRMVVASFLTKHLLIDWRWGEAYFAQKLLDYELASNNGGWQWAAGTGSDAAPYFRIFNPTLQAKKFDKENKYILKWIPELNEFSYPAPIVEHDFARKRAIETYSKALRK